MLERLRIYREVIESMVVQARTVEGGGNLRAQVICLATALAGTDKELFLGAWKMRVALSKVKRGEPCATCHRRPDFFLLP